MYTDELGVNFTRQYNPFGMQQIQFRLSFQKRKLWTMSAQVMMDYLFVYSGPDSQGITFVANRFAI